MLEVTLASKTKLNVQKPRARYAEGEDEQVTIKGGVWEIEVGRDGEAAFCIRILDDGSLIITNYRGAYETMVPQNLRLTPTRPWSSDES